MALRPPEALIAIGEGLLCAGPPVAAPFIPGHQFGSKRNHRHPHRPGLQRRTGHALRFLQKGPSDAAALERGAHGEHSDVCNGVAFVLQQHGAHELAVAECQDEAAPRGVHQFAHRAGIRPLAAEQIGLRCPPGAAGFAPVGAFDQRHEGVNVGVCGGPEGQRRGHGAVSSAEPSSEGRPRAEYLTRVAIAGAPVRGKGGSTLRCSRPGCAPGRAGLVRPGAVGLSRNRTWRRT